MQRFDRTWPWVVLIAAAVIGYLVVLKTFWFHDDWYFLANAAGIEDLQKSGSRWFSYVGYWKLFYPIFGLDTIGWGVTRLALHAGSTCLVVSIARRVGLPRDTGLFAGLLFACAPAAFESLYWGTGAVELMGAFFALASIDQWLRGDRRGIVLAVLLGVVAVGSKEAGIFLPAVYLAHAVATRTLTRWKGLALALLGAAALVAGLLLATDLEGATDYGISVASAPRNLLLLGFWLVAPPAWQTGNEIDMPWALVAGGALWLAWLVLAIRCRRQGDAAPLVALLICVLAMVPALPLKTHILPRYDYGPAAAAAIGMALLARRWLNRRRLQWYLAAAVLTVALTWSSTHYRLNAKYSSLRPIHRLVFKEYVSRLICKNLADIEFGTNDRLIFFLDPDADELETKTVFEALGVTLGPRLVIGRGLQVMWAPNLTVDDGGAYVISVKGLDIIPMGRYFPDSR